MKDCPEAIGSCRVVAYTPIDDRHRPIEACRQVAGCKTIGAVTRLAICRIGNGSTCYLFGCDDDWHCVTDSWHSNAEEAMDQAEFEYEGTRSSWLMKPELPAHPLPAGV